MATAQQNATSTRWAQTQRALPEDGVPRTARRLRPRAQWQPPLPVAAAAEAAAVFCGGWAGAWPKRWVSASFSSSQKTSGPAHCGGFRGVFRGNNLRCLRPLLLPGQRRTRRWVQVVGRTRGVQGSNGGRQGLSQWGQRDRGGARCRLPVGSVGLRLQGGTRLSTGTDTRTRPKGKTPSFRTGRLHGYATSLQTGAHARAL